MPAAFPRLLALEQKYGSLIKGQIAGARERRKQRARQRRTSPRASRSPAACRRSPTRWRAASRARARRARGAGRARRGRRLYGGGRRAARRARAALARWCWRRRRAPASALVRPLAPAAADALAAIDYAPVAVAASAYRRADVAHSLAGFGFLVPKMRAARDPRHAVLEQHVRRPRPGGHRAADDVRRRPAQSRESRQSPTTESRRWCTRELAALVGARAAPLWPEVMRWPRAIPQYDLGHLGASAHGRRARSARCPGFASAPTTAAASRWATASSRRTRRPTPWRLTSRRHRSREPATKADLVARVERQRNPGQMPMKAAFAASAHVHPGFAGAQPGLRPSPRRHNAAPSQRRHNAAPHSAVTERYGAVIARSQRRHRAVTAPSPRGHSAVIARS